MSHVIIGTAGHIDHGKTALVKALTGMDPDRLKEEKERGLTIDLGFAFLGDRAAIIDVPGHERFVKNMVAGVSTIDLVLFLVAADDGVMPQTREHLDILDLLQVRRGFIIITKIDLVDEEWLELVKVEVGDLVKGTFLEGAPMYAVSSTTGAGIDELRRAIDDEIERAGARRDQGIFWLPVDRSFSIKGFGTVVTGSVLSGKVRIGDELDLLPQGKRLRIRGLQTHGKAAELVQLGDRAALNLGGIHKDEIQRGDTLATPGYFSATRLIDARLRLLGSCARPFENRTRVRLHIGTREILARVILLDKKRLEPGDSGYVQMRLEEQAVCRRLDPFVIRQYSPTITIGGGIILDPSPRPHRRFRQEVLSHVRSLEQESPGEVIATQLHAYATAPRSAEQIARDTGIIRATVDQIIQELLDKSTLTQLGTPQQPTFILAEHVERLKEAIPERLQDFHSTQPLRAGISHAELRELIDPKLDVSVLNYALARLAESGMIIESGTSIALVSHKIVFSEKDEVLRMVLSGILKEAKFSTPVLADLAREAGATVDDASRVLAAMRGTGEVYKLEGDLFFHAQSIDEARTLLRSHFKGSDEISVSAFRELLGTTRRYALAILLHFDETGITERVGETRVLR